MVPHARIPVGKGYQVPFARPIHDEADIRTGAVGMITEPQHATRSTPPAMRTRSSSPREHYWALKAQHALGQEPTWPTQYGYVVKGARSSQLDRSALRQRLI